MQCLRKYEWVKLLRSHLPDGKGLMAYWAKLASHAAFRKGEALYCGYTNELVPGMWSGGMVGLKRILGIKKREAAVSIMNELSSLGYITYSIDEKTKHLVYQINDWVLKCQGEECLGKTVYAIDGYGFLCLPRNITDRLSEKGYIFNEADAWLDLWCHTVYEDPHNAFSRFAPTIQFERYGAIMTLETLGIRWGWEKTKVWRFFKKHGDVFALYRLPGNYGCVLYNKIYPTGCEITIPKEEDVHNTFEEIRKIQGQMHEGESAREYLNRLIAWYSQRLHKAGEDEMQSGGENRVALSSPIIRAYLSQCQNCKKYKYDCKDIRLYLEVIWERKIRGPCRFFWMKNRRIRMEAYKKTSQNTEENTSTTEAVIEFLTKRGILADEKIEDERLREVKQQRIKNVYHNTMLLLQHYRNIAWLLECFPDTIAEELEQPFETLDKLIDRLDVDIARGDKKLENRLAGMEKSRLMLDRVNEALSVLKKKPEDGQRLYDLIYLTYIAPEQLSHNEILYRLDLSSRHYYRCREQAINIISLRLWSVPKQEMDVWIDLISLLEGMK